MPYYLAQHQSAWGPVFLLHDQNSIFALSLPGTDKQDFLARYKKEIITQETTPSNLSQKCFFQLDEYFSGKRQSFDLVTQQAGTAFQQKVWRALTKIPHASTASYKDIAEKIKHPKAYRAVGMANNKNNIPIIIPCHRVIGHNKKLVGFAGGLALKQKLLRHEQDACLV
ncbi:MAG TPA: methylated-DNA--[protein]-cysteine S-methyltransferase [Oligoflexia bacterium]|nr:methylated-DNA--[protein]-cysteine S-methyltransferase [Oligoflexia bacterium]HMR24534.1 methylated-DNA--[protein]-cysteine S-methyltransferase [Oligoflexia bacterium]